MTTHGEGAGAPASSPPDTFTLPVSQRAFGLSEDMHPGEHQSAPAITADAVSARRGHAAGAAVVVANRLDALLAMPDDPAWQLVAEGYEPALEREIESLFTVGNGFLGVRGAPDEPPASARPRTFVAGLYNARTGDASGTSVTALVPAPEWLPLSLLIDGEPVSFTPAAGGGDHATASRRVLDMRTGVLRGEWHRDDPERGSVTLRTLRFASLDSRSVAVQLVRIEVERPCSLSLEASHEPASPDLVLDHSTPSLSTWHTADGAHRLAIATSAALHVDRRKLSPAARRRAGSHVWRWSAGPGRPATFLRFVALARAGGGGDPASAAQANLKRAMRLGLPRLYDAHVRAWAARWDAGDVEVKGDAAAQRALRFAVYHLLSAANPDDDRVSVGARGLTGDGYLGHVFWDTDIYLLPFYCHAWPEAARAMLLYRHRTLPAAHAKAARRGYRGALYAWESADTGAETTPEQAMLPDGSVVAIRNGLEEHHISADVAYAAWRYWQATGDDDFLLEAGAEILLETARFWADRAGEPGADGRYHIRAVIGPDEYHEGVDDDAFTNAMAAWNLERGVEVARLLTARWPERWAALRAALRLTDDELARWRTVADGLVLRRAAGSPLIEQFDGYFAREAVPLPPRPPLPTAGAITAIGRTQAVKQPDVIMLLALLPDLCSREVAEANFRYYEPRTAHGSSLSPSIHALVAARLGDMETAERYFRQAASIDLGEDGAASQGVHLGALGGLWMAAVFGFGGLSTGREGIRFAPHLPAAWEVLRFPVRWRGRVCRCEVERSPLRLRVTLIEGDPLAVSVGDLRMTLRAGDAWQCEWDEIDQRWKEVTT